MQSEKRKTKQRGQAILVATVFLSAISLALAVSLSAGAVRELQTSQELWRSRVSYYAAESGVEDAAYRLRNGFSVSPTYVLPVGEAQTEMTVTASGYERRVESRGNFQDRGRNLAGRLFLTTTQARFFYGIQVGDGGLAMGNNSRVNGNVYSNSSIVGAGNPVITGAAVVAGGIGSPNVEVISQTGDFAVGNVLGAMVKTTVDSAGDVGKHNALALGADGFARISYYNDSNDDLKFVRCTDVDCATKVITTVDSSGDVGKYTSLALGSDGFARISYYNDSNDDLKFVRCTDVDCATKVITTVDSSGDVGKYTSLALGSDGFARISYVNQTSFDLKFVQCVNIDCTEKNITTVDSPPLVDEVTSLTLGQDGFARISYYDDGNDDLKFVRCLDVGCATKNITTVDAANNVGDTSAVKMGPDDLPRTAYWDDSNSDVKFAQCTNADCAAKNLSVVDSATAVGEYLSLAIGADGFARISAFDDTNDDLKFIRCVDSQCLPPAQPADVAQSFQPTATAALMRIDLHLKKVGAPANAVVRIIRDVSGHPGSSGGDVLTTGTLLNSAVGTTYAWIPITLAANPALAANTPYWVVIDSSIDPANYYVWGWDNANPYPAGAAEYSPNWMSGAGSWTAIAGDLDFKIYLGGVNTRIEGVVIGDVSSGLGRANLFVNAMVHGAACPNQYCVVENPPRQELPIPDGVIQDWRDAALAGGVCGPPICDDNGNYFLDINASGQLGPIYIPGAFTLNNGSQLTLTGTVWVAGPITISNNAVVRLDSDYGQNSGVLLTDSAAVVENGAEFNGSGEAGSYVMLLSAKNSPNETVITVSNNSIGVVYYASAGRIQFSNNATAKEATGYGITLSNGAVITYDSGLANLWFSSGPGASFGVTSWEEII